MHRHTRSSWLAGSLALALLGAGFGGCVEQSADLPSEEDIKAAHEHVLTTAPTPRYPVNADLEDKLTYLGLDVDTDSVTPGKAFTLTHYWKVNNPLSDDWKLFIHLESPDSKKSHLNADHTPINGKYPLHLWKKGEIIRDIHRVSVPQSWPGNSVDIFVGAWKGPLRLKITKGPHDAENRVIAVKLPISGQKEVEHKRLIARKVKNGAIKIDGKLDEAAWKDAPSTGLFVRTMDGMKADQTTTAKVLWDDKNLYVAYEMEDKDVWSTLKKHDEKLWTQEAVEMFIDADGDGKTYVELQANPNGATFDSYLPAYRQNQNEWDSGMKAGVHVDGTVDNRTDIDKGWTVELAIPLETARGKEKEMKNVPPKVGTEWRVNFFRMDQGAGRPQVGTAWSPPLVGDFHALDKFGVLAFGDEKGTVPGSAPSAKAPAPPAPAEKGKADKAGPVPTKAEANPAEEAKRRAVSLQRAKVFENTKSEGAN
jgi:hypothetical protein